MTSKLTNERLNKILSETQETIMEHNARCVRGSVEVDARLFESMLIEMQGHRKAVTESDPVRYMNKFTGSCVALEQQPDAADDAAVYVPLYTSPQPAPVVPPVQDDIGEIRVGRLPTMNQDDYPGLGAWWVQLRTGEGFAEVLARVYGATPQEANNRAEALACRAAMLKHSADSDSANCPAIPGAAEWTDEQCLEFLSIAFRHAQIKGDLELDDIRLGVKMVNACRAAILQRGNSPVIPEGYVLVPVEMTARQMRDVQLKSELGAYATSNLSDAYSLFREFWGMALSAAPQEVTSARVHPARDE